MYRYNVNNFSILIVTKFDNWFDTQNEFKAVNAVITEKN